MTTDATTRGCDDLPMRVWPDGQSPPGDAAYGIQHGTNADPLDLLTDDDLQVLAESLTIEDDDRADAVMLRVEEEYDEESATRVAKALAAAGARAVLAERDMAVRARLNEAALFGPETAGTAG